MSEVKSGECIEDLADYVLNEHVSNQSCTGPHQLKVPPWIMEPRKQRSLHLTPQIEISGLGGLTMVEVPELSSASEHGVDMRFGHSSTS